MKAIPRLIHFWPGNAIRILSNNTLPLNQWTHIGITYDGSSRAKGLTPFKNGKQDDTKIIRII